ncbi:MAG: hypothetical protein AB1439_09965 [candidate division FCPU426 bacterium]
MNRAARWMTAGALLLAVAGPAKADWVSLDGSLDVVATEDAANPKIDVARQSAAEDVPYAVFQELNTSPAVWRGYARVWDNGVWRDVTSTAGPFNMDADISADDPDLAVMNNTGTHYVFVTWSEYSALYSRIFVKMWKNGDASWSQVPDLPNVWLNRFDRDAYYPTIALMDSNPPVPFVAWQEIAGMGTNIYVKTFNGTSWTPLADAVNRTATSTAKWPRIAIGTDDLPVVTWEETLNGNYDIYVSRWNGSAWVPLGAGLKDQGPTIKANEPALAIDAANRPWVVFLEGSSTAMEVKVKRFDGVNWGLAGSAVTTGLEAEWPRLELAQGGEAFVSLVDLSTAPSQQVRVYQLVDQTWTRLGVSTNVNPADNGDRPDVVVKNGQPVCVWSEQAGNRNVYVKQWVPPTPLPTSTPTTTPTPGPVPTSTPPAVASALSPNTAKAYPIPASSHVTFAFRADGSSGEAVVRLYNTHYRLITQVQGAAVGGLGEISLEVSDIAPGIYFYQVVVGDKKLPMGKLVVAR